MAGDLPAGHATAAGAATEEEEGVVVVVKEDKEEEEELGSLEPERSGRMRVLSPALSSVPAPVPCDPSKENSI